MPRPLPASSMLPSHSKMMSSPEYVSMEITESEIQSTFQPPSRHIHPFNKRLKQILGPDWQEGYTFLLPSAIFLFGVVALPFLIAFLLSFTNTHRLGEIGPYVGMQNYVRLWQDQFFRGSVWITAQYTFWTVLLKFLLGLVVALLLNRLRRSAAAITALLFLPWVMPEMVRAVTWKGLLDPLYGMVNRLLLLLGVNDRAIPFLGDPDTALAAVIVVNVWAGIPLVAIILLAGLKALDRELYEAAAIDGASAWRQFLHITLPGLRYVAIVALLLNTIWSFNDFTPIFVMTRGGPLGTTTVYTIRVVEAAQHGRFGVGVAMGLTMFPVLGLFIFFLSRYMIAGNQKSQSPTHDTLWGIRQTLANLCHWLLWPLQALTRFANGLFWLVNNRFEALFQRLSRLAHSAFGGQSQSAYQLQARIGKGLIILLLTILLVFEIGPFYWVVITSFKTTLQITTLTNELWPTPWTLEQFQRIFAPTESFLFWLKNTAVVALITPLISTLVGAFSAYGLARLRWRGSTLFSGFVLVAYMLPAVLLLIPLMLIFRATGLFGSLWSLVIAYPSFTLPFTLWMMLGYYASIPAELEDAALIDGCNRFQVFGKIILPLTTPALTAVFLFSVVYAWGEFLYAFSFLAGDRGITLPVGLAYMVNSDVAAWGEVTAITMIMAIPVFLLYAFGQRLMVSGLTAGAIKGG